MTNQSSELASVFHALSDPTRLAVLERLSRGPAPTKELAQSFSMALPSFLQHLDVLEDCGLVRSKKVGRVRTYQISHKPFKTVETWLSRQRVHWEKRLNQLDEFLMQQKESEE